MKSGWERKQIGEILKLEYGKPLPDVDRTPTGQFPVYGANGEKNRTDKFYFDKPSIIVGRKGSAGEINLTESKFWPLDVTYFVKFDEKKYQLNFLYYLLMSFDLTKLAKGVKPGINRNEVYSQKTAIPPLPEQRRIVAILDEAFADIAAAKEKAEQNLKNAKEVFESRLQGIFTASKQGWKNVMLGNICKITDGTHFSPKNYPSGDYMYVTAKNIKPYYVDLSKITYISKDDHQEIYKRCPVEKGDILYIKDGATAGIASINPFEHEFSLLSSVALIKCGDKINNKFLVHYMNSRAGKENFLGYVDGAAITRLTLTKIKNVSLSIPDYKTQCKISQQFDNLSAETSLLESLYQQKLSDLEELKKSVLQQAFSGAL